LGALAFRFLSAPGLIITVSPAAGSLLSSARISGERFWATAGMMVPLDTTPTMKVISHREPLPRGFIWGGFIWNCVTMKSTPVGIAEPWVEAAKSTGKFNDGQN